MTDNKTNRIVAAFPRNDASLPDLADALLAGQKAAWPLLGAGYAALQEVRERVISEGDVRITLQHNPKRINSTGANMDPGAINRRPCFLCAPNLPAEQRAIRYRRRYLILCNPYPIVPRHFTIAFREHRPQSLRGALPSFLRLAKDFHPDFAVLYNGPSCGASAPDHLHFQALPKAAIPALHEGTYGKQMLAAGRDGALYQRSGRQPPALIIEGSDETRLTALVRRVMKALGKALSVTGEPTGEPMVNLFCVYQGGAWLVIIFPRRAHRPAVYHETGAKRIVVSPGAVDMGGLVILPRTEDFSRLDAPLLRGIFRDVSLSEREIAVAMASFRQPLKAPWRP